VLYLHEIIDIVGTGQEAYMQTVIERARHSEGESISRLMGCWKVIGSTHRWPRVVNLWEMDGWTHWAETLERQFIPEKKDPALAPWWAKATEWRSGGFDRILEPAAFSPDRAALLRSGIRSWVSIHSMVRTRPGRLDEFLGGLASAHVPVAGRAGLTLFGAYRSVMRSDEAIVIWAARDFRDACRAFEAARQDPSGPNPANLTDDALAEHETMWLVPADGCFFHPRKQA
jgi:hypothetical protein